ncbi:MAG: DUF2721 domain-containing protein [Opitutaceae bacterium]|nr:DUF2721 domain-containing protein [Verrucomicrobiales bacterium]
MDLKNLVPILQLAVGPVILISGVGMLVLTMTNRFARIIDRSRQLAEAVRRGTPEERERYLAQLRILGRRARMVRAAIALATVSVLLAAILVIVLFLAALMGWEVAGLLVAIFIACLLALTASLILFLLDINVSLTALKLEIADTGAGGS